MLAADFGISPAGLLDIPPAVLDELVRLHDERRRAAERQARERGRG